MKSCEACACVLGVGKASALQSLPTSLRNGITLYPCNWGGGGSQFGAEIGHGWKACASGSLTPTPTPPPGLPGPAPAWQKTAGFSLGAGVQEPWGTA